MIYFFHLLNSLGSSEDSDEHYPNIGKADEQVFLVVCEHFFLSSLFSIIRLLLLPPCWMTINKIILSVPKLKLNGPYVFAVFVHNKATREDFHHENLSSMHCMTSSLFQHSRLKLQSKPSSCLPVWRSMYEKFKIQYFEHHCRVRPRCHFKYERLYLTTFPNTKRRVESTTRSTRTMFDELQGRKTSFANSQIIHLFTFFARGSECWWDLIAENEG